MWMWLWWAVRSVGWGLGLWALGPLCTWAAVSAGIWLCTQDWGAWLRWAELEALACHLHWAPPGEARLAPLRRLAAWAKSNTCSCGSKYFPCSRCAFPRPLPRHLQLDCVEVMGTETAPLLLDVLALPSFTRWEGLQCAAARAEFFSEASLARLRLFFLNSRDGTVDKAFLRLFAQASSGLAVFASEPALAMSGQCWAVEGRAQLGRQQAFLRDARVLRAVRGLLMDGDPHELLPDALRLYSSLLHDYPQSPGLGDVQLYRDVKKNLGESFLVRPILPDLFRHMERIPQLSRLVRVQLFPSEEPMDAKKVVRGFVLPQLERAEELSPEALGWLASAFPTKPLRPGPSSPPGAPFACRLGRDLRSQLFCSFGRALRTGRLSADQTWGLLKPLRRHHWVMHDRELFGRIPDAFGGVPVPADLRYDWLQMWRELRIPAMGREESARLVWAGGLARLSDLLFLGPPPGWPRRDGNRYYGELWVALSRARQLLRPTTFVLGREEAERRLLAWRDQGLGPLLRRFLDQPQPHQGSEQVRFPVRELLRSADALLRAHPPFPHSLTHADLHFPLH